ncbi:beta-ketoacyl synthase N-terminal-like domain-containing protein [Streptomyces aureoverticillatus]|uniref:beta-ketoacyl synthase N-terminal-like domain-containing protein n=1 Tax=Streptomyces aureoverticillatus TaxID=66871 RepID=UPI0013DC8CC2|nr:hypothetical protein G3H79_02365 [Streptomyces aureoverticillatus]
MTFDAHANGFVRGEGGGLVVLKQLDRALADGDPVRAGSCWWRCGPGSRNWPPRCRTGYAGRPGTAGSGGCVPWCGAWRRSGARHGGTDAGATSSGPRS